jgi:AraC-like DNA-binding protein
MASTLAETLWRVINFGEEAHPPHVPHWNDNRRRRPADTCVFQYVLSGEMTFEQPDGRQRVTADQAAIFRYGEPTAYGVGAGARRGYRTAWATLRGAGLGEHLAALRQQHGSIVDFGADPAYLAGLRELMRLADPRARSAATSMASAVHGFVMQLTRYVEQTRRAVQSPAERAVDELLRHPASALSLKGVADRHGVSREHLTRVFTERTGRPPARYLAEQRLTAARELLRQTSLPIAAVARQAGYHSAHHLARHMRRATGCSPTRWRQRIQSAPT